MDRRWICGCLIALGLGVVTATPSASSQTDVDGWNTQPFGIDVDRRGSATEDYSVRGWRLDPVASAQPHIRFNCSERAGLVAIVSPTPEKAGDLGARFSPKVRKTRLKIEGRKAVMANWLHIRETGIMQTRENAVAKRIFNAVITQAPIEVKLPLNQGEILLTPPKPDGAFRTFMKECGLAN